MMSNEKEKRVLKRETKKKKEKIIIDFFFVLLTILSSAYFIYSLLLLGPIEKIIRYVIIALVALFDLVLFINLFKKKKKRRIKKSIKRFFLLCLVIIYLLLAYNINSITSILSSTNKKYVTTSASLVTLKTNEINDVKDVKNAKIAIGNDKEDTESYVIPKEIVDEYGLDKNNEIIEYEDYQSMIRDLYDDVVQYIFLPSEYASIFGQQEEYETLEDDTKIIVSSSKEETKEEKGLLGTAKDITKPFTILLLGVDSKANGIKNADSFNGDAMILVTFNPDTLTATMLSIPRDSYVPIACMTNQTENKITHAAARGTKCAINTIQNYFGITIDYYIKINFTGLVNLVDAVGGIDVDVPYSLCEQNSKRKWGKSTVYVKAGKQHLNGEQALALSRNRHKPNDGSKVGAQMAKYCPSSNSGVRNDFVRGQNQQMVVRAIIDKIKGIDDVSKFKEILNTLSKNMDNNMSLENILSFYNIAKDILLSSRDHDGELVNIQKLYLAGSDQRIYDERTNLVLYNYIPNQESKRLITAAMKENLGLSKPKVDTSFSFSIEDYYEQNTIGRYPRVGTTLYSLIPDFTTYSRTKAESWARENGFQIIWDEVETTKYAAGKIYKQSYPFKKRIDLCSPKTITLTIAKKKETVVAPPVNEDPIDDDNTDDSSSEDSGEQKDDDNSESSDGGGTSGSDSTQDEGNSSP